MILSTQRPSSTEQDQGTRRSDPRVHDANLTVPCDRRSSPTHQEGLDEAQLEEGAAGLVVAAADVLAVGTHTVAAGIAAPVH